jgi:hypothetical protein
VLRAGAPELREQEGSMSATGETYPHIGDVRAQALGAGEGEAALEVVVLWGEHSVLHVAQASPPQPFCVGDAARDDGRSATDFVIGSEALGCDRLPIAVCEAAAPAVVVAAGAQLELLEDGRCVSQGELAQDGRLQPYPELHGARLCRLPLGATARLQHGAFTFLVTLTPPVPRVGMGLAAGAIAIDRKAMPWTLSSIGVHLGMLLLFHLLPPHSSALSIEDYARESRLPIVVKLADETEPPEVPDVVKPGDNGGIGAPAEQGEVGKAGDDKAPETKRRLAVKGPKDNPDPALPRDVAEAEARNTGVIGMLRAAAASSSPSSIFGRDNALGADPESALGALLGDRIGASYGLAGGGMVGTGRHGGGDARGTIGLAGLSTIGGLGGKNGSGTGYGRPGGMLRRESKVPPVLGGTPQVRGALSKEVIRREIHRHLNEIRFCYEEGLRGQPDLQGRVAVKFVIAASGAVQAAARASSDLGHARTEQCIVTAVKRWTFPAPDGGGLVIVTYPFSLQQTGG